MRTTLTLDDDIVDIASRQARLRGISIGKAVSDLARKGLAAPTAVVNRDGVVVFDLPDDSPSVTTADVRGL